MAVSFVGWLASVKLCFTEQSETRSVNVNHLTKLQYLNAAGESGIDQTGISELHNLIELQVEINPKITSVKHLTKLQTLNAISLC